MNEDDKLYHYFSIVFIIYFVFTSEYFYKFHEVLHQIA